MFAIVHRISRTLLLTRNAPVKKTGSATSAAAAAAAVAVEAAVAVAAVAAAAAMAATTTKTDAPNWARPRRANHGAKKNTIMVHPFV